MKKILISALSIALSLAVSVPAFAQHIYIGETETVVSYDENGNKIITLIFDPAKRPDYMDPDSPNYWRKAEQVQAQEPVMPQTLIGTMGSIKQSEKETAFEVLPPLAEAPEIGTVLANIQQEDENGKMQYTEAYRSGIDGQCTWYVRGRFREIYGMELPVTIYLPLVHGSQP